MPSSYKNNILYQMPLYIRVHFNTSVCFLLLNFFQPLLSFCATFLFTHPCHFCKTHHYSLYSFSLGCVAFKSLLILSSIIFNTLEDSRFVFFASLLLLLLHLLKYEIDFFFKMIAMYQVKYCIYTKNNCKSPSVTCMLPLVTYTIKFDQ